MDFSMRYVRFLLECVITVLYFWPIRPRGPRGYRHIALGALSLAGTFSICYYIDALPSDAVRFLIRVALIALYVFFTKRTTLSDGLYLAMLCWLAINICTEAFLTPLLYPLFFAPTLGQVTIGTLITLLLYFVLCMLSSRMIPLDSIHRPAPFRFLFLVALCVVEIYIKQTLNAISSTGNYNGPVEFSVYMVLLQLLLFVLVVSFERHLHSRHRMAQEHINAVAEVYRYKAALRSFEQTQAERRIHHDMKNHLLALRSCLERNEDADHYLTQLMDELSTFEVAPYTGTPILDGLLAEKCSIARENDIDLTLQFGVWRQGLLADMDTIVIFGNLLDNALEASKQVPDHDLRSILLKTSTAAGGIQITITNYFHGELNFKKYGDHLPKTTKTEEKAHGIGLGSVKHSLEKYNGTLTVDVLPGNRFVVTVFIP